MPEKQDPPKITQYAAHFSEPVRFSDTDMLGHANNAVFGKFFEGARVAVIYDEGKKLASAGTFFVIAHMSIDYLAEINWPSDVVTGTNVVKVGRSSITFDQAIFVSEKCVARAGSVIVLMDEVTRRSSELSPELRTHFMALNRPD